MRVPINLGMAGRYRVYVLDEFGNIERGRGGVPVARDPSGFLHRVGDWHENMIVDQGLDQVASYQWVRPDSNAGMRKRLRVGDDGTAPATTDTTLGNEVGWSESDGGFGSSWTLTQETTELHYRGVRRLVYTANGAQNIREFGLSPYNANIGVRELPRDGNGDPITLSLADGKKFRLDHDGSMYIPLETTVASVAVPEYDAGGSLVTTRTFANALVWPVCDLGSGIIYGQYLEPDTLGFDLLASTAVHDTKPSNHLTGFAPGGTRDNGGRAPDQAYTPGSFSLDVGGRLGEADGNAGGWATFCLGADSATTLTAGYVVALQDGTHPKDSVHTLDMFLELTWSRR